MPEKPYKILFIISRRMILGRIPGTYVLSHYPPLVPPFKLLKPLNLSTPQTTPHSGRQVPENILQRILFLFQSDER